MNSVSLLHRTGILCVMIIMNRSELSQGETSCITTHDEGRQGYDEGTGGGVNCVFPFIYRGRTFSECTNLSSDGKVYNAWCATTDKFDRWGYCIIPTYGGNANGANCQFPFTYRTGQNTVEYKSCVIAQDGIQTWCEVGDGDKWGYCDMTCSGGASIKEGPTATPMTTTATTTSCISTHDESLQGYDQGTGGGANCVFPFIYRGRIFSECTDVSSDEKVYNAWCATTDKFDRWGYCIIPTYGGNANGANCQFPFTYRTGQNTVEYKSCVIAQDGIQTWCEVGDGDKWGYCDMTCSGEATTMTVTTATPMTTPATTTTLTTPAPNTAMDTPAQTTLMTPTAPITAMTTPAPITAMVTPEPTTPIDTPATTIVLVIVIVVVIKTGVVAMIVCVIVYRKKQRNAGERPTVDTSAYYNVSAEIAESSNTGDMYQPLVNAAAGSNTGDMYQPLVKTASGSDL